MVNCQVHALYAEACQVWTMMDKDEEEEEEEDAAKADDDDDDDDT